MSSKAAQSIDTYVAARLRVLRMQKGISQAEIAKEIGVTFQQIQKYEAGINRISAGRIFQLSRMFGVSVCELFPKSATTSDGKRRSEKLDEIMLFAATPAGTELCQAFLKVGTPKRRKILMSLLREMADE